jgi:hypothetical protein
LKGGRIVKKNVKKFKKAHLQEMSYLTLSLAVKKFSSNTHLQERIEELDVSSATHVQSFEIFTKDLAKHFPHLPKVKKFGIKFGPILKIFQALGVYAHWENAIHLECGSYDRAEEVGNCFYKTFIHEFGHMLDFTIGKGFPTNWYSEGCPIFHELVVEYVTKLEQILFICEVKDDLGIFNERDEDLVSSLVKTSPEYISDKSEIFARAFELYIYEKDNVYAEHLETDALYTVIQGELKEKMFNYLDHLLAVFY